MCDPSENDGLLPNPMLHVAHTMLQQVVVDRVSDVDPINVTKFWQSTGPIPIGHRSFGTFANFPLLQCGMLPVTFLCGRLTLPETIGGL